MEEAAAGAAAGIVGTVLGYPFDTARIQTQQGAGHGTAATFRSIVRHEGTRGLFAGAASPLVALTVLNMLNFSGYARAREALGVPHTFDGSDGFDARVPIAGAVCGPAAALISTPFERVKLQLQANREQRFRGSVDAASHILRHHGVRSLYAGQAVNTARETVFLAVYFGVYEHTRAAISQALPGAYGIPLAGGISGAMGWFVSFPLDLVKSNIQGEPLDRSAKGNRSASAVAAEVWEKAGARGLFRGVTPSLVRAFLVSGSRFTAYEGAMAALSGSDSSGGGTPRRARAAAEHD